MHGDGHAARGVVHAADPASEILLAYGYVSLCHVGATINRARDLQSTPANFATAQTVTIAAVGPGGPLPSANNAAATMNVQMVAGQGDFASSWLFVPDRLVVKAGRQVEFLFENNDLMPHNFVITQPGALEEIGEVVACSETITVALEQDHLDGSIRLGTIERIRQHIVHRTRERVLLVGTLQRQNQDAIRKLCLDVFVHG